MAISMLSSKQWNMVVAVLYAIAKPSQLMHLGQLPPLIPRQVQEGDLEDAAQQLEFLTVMQVQNLNDQGGEGEGV